MHGSCHSGGSYVGDLQYGKPHGKGKWTSEGGTTTYKGEWSCGKKHGRGTYRCLASSYKGQWKNDLRHGQGTWKRADGVYKGQLEDNQPHGLGTWTCADRTGDYSGLWEGGEPCPSATAKLSRKQRQKSRSKTRKKQVAKKVNGRRGGGFIDVANVSKATGKLRSCMQDTAIEGAARLGSCLRISKDALYAEVPPLKTKDTCIEDIVTASAVAQTMTFAHEPRIHQAEGGIEYALLQITDGPPRFVMSTVHGRTTTRHAFLYDPTAILPGPYVAHRGLLIDNRMTAPVRTIQEMDRASVAASRRAINTFFKAETRISHVYRLMPANTSS